jgi:thiosulfate/3-mercaptopyruvate sulfurtransferase
MISFPVATVAEIEAHAAAGGPVLWFDARAGEAGRAAYAAGHVAGAVHVELERDLSGDTSDPARGGRHPLPEIGEWATRLGKLGIGPDSIVVVYDDKGGANAAARFWWMLRAVGHRNVALVDGGWPAIVAAGVPTDARAVAPVDVRPYPVRSWQLGTEDMAQVQSLAADRVLLDVREGARFRGEVEQVDPVAGHIPGARNLFFGENLGGDGRFLSPAELRAKYTALLGGKSPEALVVSCGSGVTACHTLVALDRAGLHGAKLYVGSWSEWCRAGGKIARGED